MSEILHTTQKENGAITNHVGGSVPAHAQARDTLEAPGSVVTSDDPAIIQEHGHVAVIEGGGSTPPPSAPVALDEPGNDLEGYGELGDGTVDQDGVNGDASDDDEPAATTPRRRSRNNRSE